jgi:hypothetical protein
MKVDKDETIGGKPFKHARDLLRKANRDVAAEFSAKFFDPPEVLEEMLKRGWIARSRQSGLDGRWYELTELGNSIANARLLKRINRAKANKLVADLLDRVDTINEDGAFVFRIAEVRAFGSYITGANDVGDIDLALRLERRTSEGDFVEALLKYAEESGRVFNSYFDMLTFAGTDIRRRVRAKSPYISLHELGELNELKTPSKLLYPRNKETAVLTDETQSGHAR